MIIKINDEDAIMIVIDRKAPWILELAWLVAFLAELGHERAIVAREYLHSIVLGVSDEQETSMMVERQATREMEQAISIAWLLGADRELDSSISIKSIVSHLFHVSLSHTTTKEMVQAPNCSSQRDEDMKLSHTRDTRDTKQRSKEQHLPRTNHIIKEARTRRRSYRLPIDPCMYASLLLIGWLVRELEIEMCFIIR